MGGRSQGAQVRDSVSGARSRELVENRLTALRGTSFRQRYGSRGEDVVDDADLGRIERDLAGKAVTPRGDSDRARAMLSQSLISVRIRCAGPGLAQVAASCCRT